MNEICSYLQYLSTLFLFPVYTCTCTRTTDHCGVNESYPLHSPEELELLPGVSVGNKLLDPTPNALLHVQTELIDLRVKADITEERELHRLILCRDHLWWCLDTRPSQPAGKFLDAGEREHSCTVHCTCTTHVPPKTTCRRGGTHTCFVYIIP